MKKWLLLLLVPLAASAAGDYARQWPLRLSTPDAGAYRVTLNDPVYRQLQSPLLADLDVVDAQGRPVPAALLDPSTPATPEPRTVELPWFPLPPEFRGNDVASISEIDADGRLRRVEVRTVGGGSVAGNGFLLDASGVEAPIAALRVQWAAGQAPLDLAVRVSASDDLRRWRVIADEAHLVELANAGQRVVRDRIELSPVKARYLRISPLDTRAQSLRVSTVTAQLESTEPAPAWHWVVLAGTRVDDGDGSVHYEYALDGRFPVAQADIALPGNSTGQWRLQAREQASQPWRDVAAPWVAFRLEGRGNGDASPPQPLSGIRRDRFWRLTPLAGAPLANVPRLRLGYVPETLVFVASGEAPFALVAGSARSVRADAPIERLVDAVRAQRGARWQPAVATLGESAERGGASALAPARDWKTWLLWALLIAGAALVGGFAISLLRKPAP
ncbi:DUF3999 domain-containing protein [Lysobacter arvi]|uniref:DUF3999 domain-containing protein n=1 Tax=Lysobacter arvi TaxID=3038776 RepID=A0ABU1CCS3_9GAMM|nr:DUF3999 domain-containing protein [Lysobacter arvi]MDR0182880.1 DUF3999 domain-containing protein [Lysobacter arvi]